MPCQRCLRRGWQCRYLDPPNHASDQPKLTELLPLDVSQEILDIDFDCQDISTDFSAGLDAGFGADEADPSSLALLPAISPIWAPTLTSFSLKPFQLAKIEYPCRILMAAPAPFVHENQTPWAHASLWEDEMPKCLRGEHCQSLSLKENPVIDTAVLISPRK